MSFRKLALILIASVLTLPVFAQAVNGVPNQGVVASPGGAPLLSSSPSPLNTTAIQAIPRASSMAVNGVFNGDSYNICDHTICGNGGGPTASTNRIPEQIRINYQGLYGNGGTGIVPLIYSFAASPSPVNSEAWSVSGTYDTNVTALGPTQSSQGTIVNLASGAVATFSDSRNIAYTGGNVYFATQTGSGTCSITVDGTATTSASASSFTTAGAVNGGYTARVLTLPSFSSATNHSVVFTATGGTCSLYGFEGTNGTTGVRIHNVSVGGATAASVGATASAENAFTDLIPTGVQFETLAFLTNDAAAAVGTSTFSTNLTNVVSHFQALTSGPTVVLVVPPVSIVNATHAEAAYTAVITGLATSLNLASVNFQNQGATVGSTYVGFGTATPLSSNPWFDWTGAAWPTGNAGVHPSDIGAPVEAQLLSAALLNPVPVGQGCGVGIAVCAVNAGTTSVATTITSSAAAGTILEVMGTGTNVDTWAFQSAGNTTISGGKTGLLGDFTTGSYALGLNVSAGGAGYADITNGMSYCWSSATSITVSLCDTGLSRISANMVGVGNGTAGNSGGVLKLAAVLPNLYSAAGTVLPTCAVGIKGQMAVVSDATSPTYMSAYTSGGGITAAVICSYNGTTYAWLTH